jgi:hypothetical protein
MQIMQFSQRAPVLRHKTSKTLFGAVTIPTNNIYDAGPIRSFCVVTETDLEDLLCIHSGIIYIKCIAIFRTFITSLPFHLIFFLAHLSQR